MPRSWELEAHGGVGDQLLTLPLWDHGCWRDLIHSISSVQGLSSAKGLLITKPGLKGGALPAQPGTATDPQPQCHSWQS